MSQPQRRRAIHARTAIAEAALPVTADQTSDKPLLIEYCCTSDSILGQVSQEFDTQIVRVTEQVDATSPATVNKLLALIRKRSKIALHASVPCTAVSKWVALNAATRTSETQLQYDKLLCKTEIIISNLSDIADEVVRIGGHISFEWPAFCPGWKLQSAKSFVTRFKLRSAELHGCAVGLHAKYAKGYLKKPWCVASNNEILLEELSRMQCPGGHNHVPCEGRETKQSSIYPFKVCRILWQSVVEFLDDKIPHVVNTPVSPRKSVSDASDKDGVGSRNVSCVLQTSEDSGIFSEGVCHNSRSVDPCFDVVGVSKDEDSQLRHEGLKGSFGVSNGTKIVTGSVVNDSIREKVPDAHDGALTNPHVDMAERIFGGDYPSDDENIIDTFVDGIYDDFTSQLYPLSAGCRCQGGIRTISVESNEPSKIKTAEEQSGALDKGGSSYAPGVLDKGGSPRKEGSGAPHSTKYEPWELEPAVPRSTVSASRKLEPAVPRSTISAPAELMPADVAGDTSQMALTVHQYADIVDAWVADMKEQKALDATNCKQEKKQPHRTKYPKHNPPVFALVTRQIKPSSSEFHSSACQAALHKELSRLRAAEVWHEENPMEWQDVKKIADPEHAKGVMVGRLFAIMGEKCAEESRPLDQREYKARVVFGGHRIETDTGRPAHELFTAASAGLNSMVTARTVVAVAVCGSLSCNCVTLNKPIFSHASTLTDAPPLAYALHVLGGHHTGVLDGGIQCVGLGSRSMVTQRVVPSGSCTCPQF